MSTRSPHSQGLEQLSGRYNTIYCDIWGVLHNGIAAHRAACIALENFRAGGGHVALITNAPRRTDAIVQMLNAMHISTDCYDVIVSSGDVTRTLISDYSGQTVHHVGPAHGVDLFEGIDVKLGPAEEAQAVVVSDLDDPADHPNEYADRMAAWLRLDLPMICANPDKIVEIGDKMVFCGGSLADLYQEAGGTVLLAGKPFAPIYDRARTELARLGARKHATKKSLAIGDAVRTDAQGAANQGMDFYFVTGSVHAEEIQAAQSNSTQSAVQDLVTKIVAPSGANMVAHAPELTW